MTTTWGNANVPWSGSATVARQLIRSQNFANRRARHQWPWIVYGSCATVDWTDIEPVKQNVNQNVTHTISYKWPFKSHHLTQTSASLMKNHRGHVTNDNLRFSCIQNTRSIASRVFGVPILIGIKGFLSTFTLNCESSCGISEIGDEMSWIARALRRY